MYCPKTFPANAFYLDYNLNVHAVVVKQGLVVELSKCRRPIYGAGHRLFSTRKRALSAAANEIGKLEKRLAALAKEIDSKRARVAKQAANCVEGG